MPEVPVTLASEVAAPIWRVCVRAAIPLQSNLLDIVVPTATSARGLRSQIITLE